MIRRHVASIVLSACAVSTAVSCKSASQPAPEAAAGGAAAQPPVVVAQSDANGPKIGEPVLDPTDPGEASTADMLARKAESYAETLESLIQQRAAVPAPSDEPSSVAPAPAPVDAAPQSPVATVAAKPEAPSVVEWLDPKTGAPVVQAVAPDGSTIAAHAGTAGVTVNPAAPAAPAPMPQQIPTTPNARPLADSSPPSANAVAAAPESTASLAASVNEAGQPAPAAAAAAPVSSPPVITEVRPAASNNNAAGLEAMGQRLAQRVNDYPHDAAAHFDYQLFRFLREEPVPELSSIASLPVEDREMLTVLFDGLSNYRTQLRADANMLLSRKVRPLLEMSDRLRAQADLNIPRIVVCRDVKQFGVYEPIEPARFASGRDHDVIIYCEIANFASQLNDVSHYETKLTYSASLFTETEAGLEVWQSKPAEIVDTCRNRRHDFFIADKVKLPAALTIGGYLFKVSIVDQHANRIAEATVPLQIVAQ